MYFTIFKESFKTISGAVSSLRASACQQRRPHALPTYSLINFRDLLVRSGTEWKRGCCEDVFGKNAPTARACRMSHTDNVACRAGCWH